MYQPGFQSRRFIDNVEIKPGAVVNHDPQAQFRFSMQAVCQAVDPDLWIGQLSFNGLPVAQTDPVMSFEQATTAAKKLLTDRITALFA